MERMNAGGHWDYTVAELRQIAADRNLRVAMRMTHDQLVELITAAGIQLPPKPPQRMPPYRRKRGPLAERDIQSETLPAKRGYSLTGLPHSLPQCPRCRRRVRSGPASSEAEESAG
jgi:hypothetical protein